jgi:hypothetical protein
MPLALLDDGVIVFHGDVGGKIMRRNKYLPVPTRGIHRLRGCIDRERKRIRTPTAATSGRWDNCQSGGAPLFCFACNRDFTRPDCEYYRQTHDAVRVYHLVVVHGVGSYSVRADLIWEAQDDE